jgi:hypothetical protein
MCREAPGVLPKSENPIHWLRPWGPFLNDYAGNAQTQANDPELGERKTSRMRLAVKEV